MPTKEELESLEQPFSPKLDNQLDEKTRGQKMKEKTKVNRLIIIGTKHRTPDEKNILEELSKRAKNKEVFFGRENEYYLGVPLDSTIPNYQFGIDNYFIHQFNGLVLNTHPQMGIDRLRMSILETARGIGDYQALFDTIDMSTLTPSGRALYDVINAIIIDNANSPDYTFGDIFMYGTQDFDKIEVWQELSQNLMYNMLLKEENFPMQSHEEIEEAKRMLENLKNENYSDKSLQNLGSFFAKSNYEWREKYINKNILEVVTAASNLNLDAFITIGSRHLNNMKDIFTSKEELEVMFFESPRAFKEFEQEEKKAKEKTTKKEALNYINNSQEKEFKGLIDGLQNDAQKKDLLRNIAGLCAVKGNKEGLGIVLESITKDDLYIEIASTSLVYAAREGSEQVLQVLSVIDEIATSKIEKASRKLRGTQNRLDEKSIKTILKRLDEKDKETIEKIIEKAKKLDKKPKSLNNLKEGISKRDGNKKNLASKEAENIYDLAKLQVTDAAPTNNNRETKSKKKGSPKFSPKKRSL